MRRRFTVLIGIAIVVIAGVVAPAGSAQARPHRSKVADLVAQLTLDEKISLLHGATDPAGQGQSGYLPGVPRLGIPELRLTDGAAGIRMAKPALAMPAPVALASAFDPALARQYGAAIGRDGRALGMDVLLGPTLNTIRVPYNGRNFETYSEDQLLTARTVAADITGIQSQGMIATAKHFAVNNQETDRDTVNVNVGEQALHEIELPGFAAAVKAGAGAIMCAYNQVNGAPSCGNTELLQTVLREQLHFTGWVMSDWSATHSTDSITKGLDQEMPDGTYLGDALKKAVQDGTIPMSAVDQSVTRILTVLDRFKLLGPHPRPRPTRDPAGGAAVAQRVAEQGAVLLRNTGSTLPLRGRDASDIAVIGPTAQTPKVSGGGSGKGHPAYAAPPLDAIRTRAHGSVTYSPGGELFGRPIPSAALDPALPMSSDGTATLPLYTGYSGTIDVPEDGDYRISASVADDSLVALYVDDRSAVGGAFGFGPAELPVHLTKGSHQLGIYPLLGPDPMPVKLGWVTLAATRSLIAQAVTAASHARTAVVFAYDDETEGLDRPSLSLAGYQDELITRVAKANPNTVVVLNTGSAITMPWLSSVRSVLDMWYPGQEGAAATAALLFGDAAPGGRLSQTFPASEQATPVGGNPSRYPGVNGQETYSEGIDVGYRWYDAYHVAPLFPFGFGLTYTSFAYNGLSVRAGAGGGLDVSVSVRNTGSRAGAAVPQVYVGTSSRVTEPQAVRALAGFDKVTLRPGESRRVHIRIDPAQLSYWDVGAHAYRLGGGARTI
ncbi:MAG TPA: glycoside hydrolase family 3 C-terminal domain-containing protein, partial [Jatrophihabitantaceae bacterium]